MPFVNYNTNVWCLRRWCDRERMEVKKNGLFSGWTYILPTFGANFFKNHDARRRTAACARTWYARTHRGSRMATIFTHHLPPLATVHHPDQRLVRERVGLDPRLAHLAKQIGGLPPPLPALEGHEHGVVVEQVGRYALVLPMAIGQAREKEEVGKHRAEGLEPRGRKCGGRTEGEEVEK